MPVIRNRLANRRQVSTVSLVWPPVSGNRYHITVGEYEDGAPGEVWVHGAKVVQRRMVPNFKKSFERAVRTARR